VNAYTLENKDTAQFKLVPFVTERFAASLDKFAKRQDIIQTQIKELEKKANSKITMDNLKTGFDKTSVVKDDSSATLTTGDKPSTVTNTTTTVEETIHTPKSNHPIMTGEMYEDFEKEVMEEFECSDAEIKACHPELLTFSKTTNFTRIVSHFNKASDFAQKFFNPYRKVRGNPFDPGTRARNLQEDIRGT
jgi:hypothetical protein